MTDQNLTTHTYTYDNLGREIADSVTLPTLGGVYNPSNIDTAVMEIGYGYNVQGNLSSVTSYNATTGGTVVNEDYMTYNDAGLPASEYQNPSGSISVNTATGAVTDSTPYVGYNYDAGNGYRLASIQYPNLKRTVSYNYGTTGTPDNSLNRLSEIDG